MRVNRLKRKAHGVLFLRNICPNLKRLFKGVVYRRGDNMTDVIAAMMRQYIKDPAGVKVLKDNRSLTYTTGG